MFILQIISEESEIFMRMNAGDAQRKHRKYIDLPHIKATKRLGHRSGNLSRKSLCVVSSCHPPARFDAFRPILNVAEKPENDLFE